MIAYVFLSALACCCLAAPQGSPQDTVQVDAHTQGDQAIQPVISTISQELIVNADGSFNNSYETSNGIKVEQTGFIKKNPNPSPSARIGGDPNDAGSEDDGDINVIQGSYSYTAPDGTIISLRYIADENGFQPMGDHIPTAHPAIQRAIAAQQQQQQGQQAEPIQVQQGQQSQDIDARSAPENILAQ